MRKLNTSDVFAFCRLIKATDAREQLHSIVSAVAKGKENGEAVDTTQVGVDAFLAILEAAVEPKAEKTICQFLSGPMECKPDEVASMELETLINNIKLMATENNLTFFFSSVSGILGKA